MFYTKSRSNRSVEIHVLSYLKIICPLCDYPIPIMKVRRRLQLAWLSVHFAECVECIEFGLVFGVGVLAAQFERRCQRVVFDIEGVHAQMDALHELKPGVRNISVHRRHSRTK